MNLQLFMITGVNLSLAKQIMYRLISINLFCNWKITRWECHWKIPVDDSKRKVISFHDPQTRRLDCLILDRYDTLVTSRLRVEMNRRRKVSSRRKKITSCVTGAIYVRMQLAVWFWGLSPRFQCLCQLQSTIHLIDITWTRVEDLSADLMIKSSNFTVISVSLSFRFWR